MNNRQSALGLGALLLGATIALGNFGYTMLATTQGVPAPAVSGAPAPLENDLLADVSSDGQSTRAQGRQDGDRRGRRTGRGAR